MKNRPLIPGDRVNFMLGDDFCYGEVVSESSSPVIGVKILYIKELNAKGLVTIQLEKLTICE